MEGRHEYGVWRAEARRLSDLINDAWAETCRHLNIEPPGGPELVNPRSLGLGLWLQIFHGPTRKKIKTTIERFGPSSIHVDLGRLLEAHPERFERLAIMYGRKCEAERLNMLREINTIPIRQRGHE